MYVAAGPGALCAAADLAGLPFDRYISGVQLGRTGHAVIVDSRGVIIASTDPGDRFAADEHPDFHTALIAPREARVGTAAYYKGATRVEDHIMAFAPSHVASWGVSFGQTEAETLAPVARTRTRMLGFGVIALLVALAFAWWDTGMVIRPLRRLVAQTRRIAEGDLAGAVPVARGDEIGELAESFEAMRVRLRSMLEDLTSREFEAHALFEVSREVVSRPDLGGVLKTVTGHARRLLEADVAVVCRAGDARSCIPTTSGHMPSPRWSWTAECRKPCASAPIGPSTSTRVRAACWLVWPTSPPSPCAAPTFTSSSTISR